MVPRVGDRPAAGGWAVERTTSPSDRVPAEGRVGGNGEAVAEGASGQRLAAMLPRDLIDGGEVVILLLKPSLWFVVLGPLRTLAAIVVLTALGVAADTWLSGGVYRGQVVLAGSAALCVRLFWQFLEWLSRAYVLTDRRGIRVRGVLTVQVFECALGRVQHTEVVRVLREQLVGVGTLAFTTAGTGRVEAWWEMVSRPMQVQQEVVRAIRRYGGRGA
jgi:hypothetical protein